MNIFIIGGTGFLSREVTQMLLNKNYKVTLYTRGKTQHTFSGNNQPILIKGNRQDAAFLKNIVISQIFDAVYDFVSYEEKESQSAIEIFKDRCSRFIHCSTVSVYMVSNEVRCPITEDQDKGPLMEYFPKNPFGMDYGIHKRECEKVLWRAYDEKEFPVTIMRPTYISGPGDPAMRDYFWVERILDDGPLLVPGSGDFAFQQVYIKDAARAFVDVLYSQSSIGQAYNVAAEEIFSLNDYLKALAKLVDRDPELVHVDQNIFDLQPFSYYHGGDVFTFNTRRTAIFSLDNIKNDLKYNSTPFEKWMPLTIDWFMKSNTGHSHGYANRKDELDFIKKWRNKTDSIIKEFT